MLKIFLKSSIAIEGVCCGADVVPDEVYERVKGQFSEGESVNLTWAVAAINVWNRVTVSRDKWRTRSDQLEGWGLSCR